MHLRTLVPTVAAGLLAGACSPFRPAPPPPTPAPATAELRDAQNRVVGTVRAAYDPLGVRLTIAVRGLPEGPHAIHLHAVGTCTPPDFASAGPHFNPESLGHGLANPLGPHAGDLPNIVVGADGSGNAVFVNPRVTLGAGASSLFDADGTAVVVHATADDQRTDPSGASGARLACGVLRR
jgi:Cu-Zn family superoxide dismutase